MRIKLLRMRWLCSRLASGVNSVYRLYLLIRLSFTEKLSQICILCAGLHFKFPFLSIFVFVLVLNLPTLARDKFVFFGFHVHLAYKFLTQGHHNASLDERNKCLCVWVFWGKTIKFFETFLVFLMKVFCRSTSCCSKRVLVGLLFAFVLLLFMIHYPFLCFLQFCRLNHFSFELSVSK